MVSTLLNLIIFTLSASLIAAENRNKTFNILTFVPFTDVREFRPIENVGIAHVMASLIAVGHFNSRNATIVPELGNLSECDYSLRISFADTKGTGTGALAKVLQIASIGTTPDAIVGGLDDDTALELSAVGSSLNIPAISYGGLEQRVVTRQIYPYAARTSPDASEMGKVMLSYLLYQRRTNYFGILYASTEAALQIQASLLEQSEIQGIVTQQSHYQPSHMLSDVGPPHDLVESLRRLRDTGFLTIILIVSDYATELPLIAEAAQSLGMISTDRKYFWLLGNVNMDRFDDNMFANESVKNLLRGGVTIHALDGFQANPASDKFLATWKESDSSIVKQSQLSTSSDETGFFVRDSYFKETNPETGSSFIYDAIIALGLGLCASNQKQGMALINAIESLSFNGASGIVQFGSSKEFPGGRAGETVSFGAFNLFPPNGSKNDVVLTDIFDGVAPSSKRGTWRSVATFIYPDGSSINNVMLREPSDQHYLNVVSLVWGLALFTMSVLFTIASVAWVYLHRTHRKVKASQPFFLYCVAFGAFLIAFATVVNTFDEGRGWSVKWLSAACTASPWTVVLGILIIYSALFCKLWRVNIVMQFRRKAVTVQSVIWPAAVLAAAALILMTVWTVVEGFKWVRTEVDHISGASYGKCRGDHTIAYFTPIFLLICIPVLLTAIMAYKTKDIDAAFSEGSWIFALIAVHIQFLLISIPLLRTLEQSSTNARYVGQATIFFAFSISTMLLIIGPKVFSVHMNRGVRDTIRASGAGGVRVSGFVPTSSYAVPSTAEVVQQPESAMPRIEEGNENEQSQRHVVPNDQDGTSSTSEHDDDSDSLDVSLDADEEAAAAAVISAAHTMTSTPKMP